VRSAIGAVALAAAGGLVLAGATVAPWVRASVTRTVGDVAVVEAVTVPGTDLVAPLLAVGLAALLVGLALMLLPTAARRVAGWSLVVLAAAGAVGIAVGARRAAALDGMLAEGPGVAGLGALLVLGGGLVVVRRPRERAALPARYSLDGPDAAGHDDDEWRLASVEDE